MRERKEVKKIKSELARTRAIGIALYNDLHINKYSLTEDEKYAIQKSIRLVEKMFKDIRVEAL